MSSINMKLGLTLLLIITIIVCVTTQKAFLFSSSVGYYNYRQNANVLKVYHTLKQSGFSENDIILAYPQNVGCCQKNPIQGSVSFLDNDYTNINKKLETDLKYNLINSQSIMQNIGLKYHSRTLNFRKLSIDSQPYFVYVTGHGGDYYFKIRQRQALVSQHFQHLFQDLQARTDSMPVFILSDSCSASTPFQQIEIDDLLGIGSSSVNQKSLSYGYDSLLNSPKSDEFTYYLSQFLQENDLKRSSATINDLWKYMDFAKLKVHAKLLGKNKKYKHQQLRTFMTRKRKIEERSVVLKYPVQLD